MEAREEVVTDFDSILKALAYGEQQQHVDATEMNARSSRSHTIFRVVVESKERFTEGVHTNEDEVDDAVRVATLNLVDLAGSESVRHTGATGQRQKEGGKINQSLLSLSRVIQTLSQGGSAHISYRDSKLTRILQPSLSGNASMGIICCATPAEGFLEETRSTLQFAQRAKMIKTHAVVNEVMDDHAQLKRLKRELADLKASALTTAQPPKAGQLQDEVDRLHTIKQEQAQKIERLTSLILCGDRKNKNNKTDLTANNSVDMGLISNENVDVRRSKRARETWCPGEIAKVNPPVALTPSCLPTLGKNGSADGFVRKRRPKHLEESDASNICENVDHPEQDAIHLNPPIVKQLEAELGEAVLRAEGAEEEVHEFAAYADEVEAENKRLEDALEKSNAELEELRQLESNIGDSELLQAQMERIQQLETELCAVRRSPECKTEELSKSKSEEECDDKASYSKELIEQYEGEIKDLNGLLQKEASETSAMKDQHNLMVAQFESEAELARNDINRLKCELDELKVNAASPANMGDDPYGALAVSDDEQENEEEVSSKGIEMRTAQEGETNEEMELKFEGMQRQIEDLSIQLQESDTIRVTTEKNMACMQEDLEKDKNDKMAEMDLERKELQKCIEELSAQLKESEALRMEAENQLRTSDDHKKSMEEELEKMQNRVRDVSDQLQESEAGRGTVEEQVKCLSAKVEASDVEVQQLVAEKLENLKELEKVQNRAQEVSAQLQESEDGRRMTEEQVKCLSSKVEASEVEVQQLVVEKSENLKEIQALESRADDVSAAKVLLEERVESLIDEHSKCLDDRNSKIKDMEVQLLDLTDDTSKEITSLKNSLSESEGERNELVIVRDEKVQEVNTLSEKLLETLQCAKAANSLEEKLTAALNNSEALCEEITDLTDQLVSKSQTIQDLQMKVQELKNDSISTEAAVHDEVSVLRQKLDKSNSAVDAGLRKIMSLESELRENRNMLASTEDSRSSMANKEDVLAKRVSQLQCMADLVISERDSAVAKLREVEKDVQRLETANKELETLERSLMEMEAQLRVARESSRSAADQGQAIQALEQRLTNELEEKMTMQSQLGAALENLKDAEAQVERLKGEISNVKEAAEIAAELEHANARLQELEAEQTQSSNRITRLQQQVDLLNTELQAALENASSQESVRLDLEKEVARGEAVSEVELRELKQELDERRTEVESLKDQVQSTEESLSCAAQMLQTVQNEASSFSELLESQKECTRVVTCEAGEAAKQAEQEMINIRQDSENSLKLIQERATELEQQLNVKTDEIISVESRLASAESKLAEAEIPPPPCDDGKAELLAEMESLMEGKISAESQVATMGRELEELRESVRDAESRSVDEQQLVIKAAEERMVAYKTKVQNSNEEMKTRIVALEESLETKMVCIANLERDLGGKLTKIAALEAQVGVTDSGTANRISELENEVTAKAARIKKLEEVRLTKDQVKKLKEMKENSRRNEYENKELTKEIADLRRRAMMSASAGGDGKSTLETATACIAELEEARDALAEKLRKYVSHCRKLEEERESSKATLENAGIDCSAFDNVADGITVLRDRIDKSNSNELSDANNYAAELQDQLQEGLISYHNLEKEAAQLRETLDGLKVGEANEESSRQIHFLEGENLQLILEIKDIKKQMAQHKAELKAFHKEQQNNNSERLVDDPPEPATGGDNTNSTKNGSKDSLNLPDADQENRINMSNGGKVKALSVTRRSRTMALIQQPVEDDTGDCKQS